jgi:hypothetical protein
VSDNVAKMPGDDPEVLHLPGMLPLSFGLQFSETEFCSWLGCVMEHVILSYILSSLFKNMNLVSHSLKIVDCQCCG